MSDSLSCGRRVRILNVIDDFSRKCLASVVDTSLSSTRVGRELDIAPGTPMQNGFVESFNGTVQAEYQYNALGSASSAHVGPHTQVDPFNP